MKRITEIKLHSILALAGGIVIQNADGQINYVNINPDAVLDPYGLWVGGFETFNIDFDGNFPDDIRVKVDSYHYFLHSESTTLVRYNRAYLQVPDDNASIAFDPIRLNAGDAIDAGLEWGGDQTIAKWFKMTNPTSGTLGYGTSGEFLGAPVAFAGLRYGIGGDKYYGWIRLVVNDSANLGTVYDYAFNSVPNVGIQAGETDFFCDPTIITEIEQIEPNKVKIYWQQVPGAIQYKLQVRKEGTEVWNTFIVDAPKLFRKVILPTCGANYKCRVAAICDEGMSPFSSSTIYALPDCRVENGSIEERGITVYPNPSSGNFTIDLEDFENEIVTIEMYDINGVLLFSEISDNEMIKKISNHFNAGTYVLKIISSDATYVKKIMII